MADLTYTFAFAVAVRELNVLKTLLLKEEKSTLLKHFSLIMLRGPNIFNQNLIKKE